MKLTELYTTDGRFCGFLGVDFAIIEDARLLLDMLSYKTDKTLIIILMKVTVNRLNLNLHYRSKTLKSQKRKR